MRKRKYYLSKITKKKRRFEYRYEHFFKKQKFRKAIKCRSVYSKNSFFYYSTKFKYNLT